jgi:hypothetical protein
MNIYQSADSVANSLTNSPAGFEKNYSHCVKNIAPGYKHHLVLALHFHLPLVSSTVSTIPAIPYVGVYYDRKLNFK